MKLKLALLVSFISILFSFHANAQDLKVSGNVTNASGEALSSATIRIKSTQRAALTDANGNFEITVPSSKSILVISYTGMVDQEIPLTPSVSVYNVKLN